MERILLVDDDLPLCELLSEYLTSEGFEVGLAHDGVEATRRATLENWDAMVLDVMMPRQNGFDTLRKVREKSDLPILMLTAKGDDIDRIVGLEMGADDYLPKPCNPRELVARIRAILRRFTTPSTTNDEGDQIVHGPISLDRRTLNATFGGDAVKLTGAEFQLLFTLAKHGGEVVSKDELSVSALNRELLPYDRSVDVHISNIRKKLAAFSPDAEFIKSLRGSGYMLVAMD